MNEQPQDNSYAVDRPSGYLYWESTEYGGRYIDSSVRTPVGFVQVYAEEDLLRLSIICDGRCYSRQWRKSFKPRYIVTLANQFAHEIWEGA